MDYPSGLSVVPSVLIVEDEQPLATVYAEWLDGLYDVTVAHSGEEALDRMGDDIDAVLLDRRMPDKSGDEVLDEMRERGFDCTVIMVTAVDPDLNILELDFDDYLCKPVERTTLLDALDLHVTIRNRTENLLGEFFESLSKIDVLQDTETEDELESNEEYRRLQRKATELANELNEMVDDFDTLVSTYREVARTTAGGPSPEVVGQVSEMTGQ